MRNLLLAAVAFTALTTTGAFAGGSGDNYGGGGKGGMPSPSQTPSMTQGQGQSMGQGQSQGQGQGQTQGQGQSLVSQNKNTNTSGSTSRATGGSATGGASRSSSSSTGGSNRNSVTVQNSGGGSGGSGGGSYRSGDTITVVPPGLAGGNVCAVSASGGLGLAGFAIGGGGAWESKNCERRQLAALAANMGDVTAAREVLCSNMEMRYAYAAAGTPCAVDRARFVAMGVAGYALTVDTHPGIIRRR